MSSEEPTAKPAYADRTYRSAGALVGGVLLLALGAWLGVDALVRGDGRTRLLTLAALLAGVPLAVAFTLRPVVLAGDDRLLVRNPFRTITLPWASVEALRARYSSEVLTRDATYQLWAIPVSLRARKKAARRQARAGAPGPSFLGFGGRAVMSDPALRAQHGASAPPPEPDHTPLADRTILELEELAQRNADREGAQGGPHVRWAYEILAPAAAGLVALVILIAVG